MGKKELDETMEAISLVLIEAKGVQGTLQLAGLIKPAEFVQRMIGAIDALVNVGEINQRQITQLKKGDMRPEVARLQADLARVKGELASAAKTANEACASEREMEREIQEKDALLAKYEVDADGLSIVKELREEVQKRIEEVQKRTRKQEESIREIRDLREEAARNDRVIHELKTELKKLKAEAPV